MLQFFIFNGQLTREAKYFLIKVFFNYLLFFAYNTVVYPEPCQTSKTECFAKIVNSF